MDLLSGTSATFAGQVSVAFSNPDVSGIELQATVGTNAAAIKITNTGGNFYIGKDKSDGSRISGTAYANAIWAENVNPLVFGVSNSEKMRISSSGSLGIGTTSNSWTEKLIVSSANGTAYTSIPQIRVDGKTNNNRAAILFTDSSLSDGKISYYPHATEATRFFSISARGTESDFIIKGNGNVGIGVTGPTKTLQVDGSIGLTTSATDGTKRLHTYPDDWHSWYYKSSVVNSQSAEVMTYYQQFIISYRDTTPVFIIRGSSGQCRDWDDFGSC